MDIDGAFDNTSYEAIEKAVRARGLDPSTVAWIKCLLKSCGISAKLGETTATIGATRGCPQGGVLSPLLLSLVVEDLLKALSDSGYDVQGYADDLVIVVRGKHDETNSRLMQNALDKVGTGV